MPLTYPEIDLYCNAKIKLYSNGLIALKRRFARNESWYVMPLSLPEFKARYNTKIKLYPNGYSNTTYCNFDIFRNPDYEKRKNESSNIPVQTVMPPLDPKTELYAEHYEANKAKRTPRKSSDEPREDNLKRAKEKIFDITLLNEFSYFITGTFANNEDLDRTDPKEIIKPLLQWLKHQTQRRGLQYVLTAERHKKSNGIHIHALVNDVLSLTYSGKRMYRGKAWNEQDILKHEKDFERFKPVYNIDNWRFGWSTAIPCDKNRLRLARYVTKYITKEQKKIFGKYYWSSKNIEREPKIILARTDFESVLAEDFCPNGTSYRFKYDSFFSEMKIDDMDLEELENDVNGILEYLEKMERIQCLSDIQD